MADSSLALEMKRCRSATGTRRADHLCDRSPRRASMRERIHDRNAEWRAFDGPNRRGKHPRNSFAEGLFYGLRNELCAEAHFALSSPFSIRIATCTIVEAIAVRDGSAPALAASGPNAELE